MASWLPSALLSLFFFGLWGIFNQLAVARIDSKSALIYQTIAIAVVGMITLSSINFKLAVDAKGSGYALLTGFVYGIGCLFYFVAASRGKVTTIVTLTALYPLVTLFFAYFFLKETIHLKQLLGMGLALIAIILLSSSN